MSRALQQVTKVHILVRAAEKAVPFLAVLYLLTIAFSKSFWLPAVLLLLLAPLYLLAGKLSLKEREYRWFFYLYLLFVVPSMLSLWGAYDVGRGALFILTTTLVFLAMSVIYTWVRDKGWDWLARASFYVVVIWCASVYLQLLSGGYFFGPDASGRYYGMFGRDNMIAGYAIMPWLGLALMHVRKSTWAIPFFAFVAGAIFASGNRAAWVSVLVFAVPVIWFYLRHSSKKWMAAGLLLVVSGGLALGFANSDAQVIKRLDRTVSQALNADLDGLNSATAGRVYIWRDSFLIFEDNLLNGVGARSFRYAYPDYAVNADYFRQEADGTEIGPFHAHQIVIQFLVDMGLIGAVAVVMLYWLLLQVMLNTYRIAHYLALPSLAFFCSVLPFNTHLNIFGGFLLVNFFFFVAVILGGLRHYSCQRVARPS